MKVFDCDLIHFPLFIDFLQKYLGMSPYDPLGYNTLLDTKKQMGRHPSVLVNNIIQ